MNLKRMQLCFNYTGPTAGSPVATSILWKGEGFRALQCEHCLNEDLATVIRPDTKKTALMHQH